MNRYHHIYDCIRDCKPKTIIDIGVHDGDRSQKIILTAKEYNSDIQYYGYDMWEDLSDEQVHSEFLYPKKKKTFQEAQTKIAAVLGPSQFFLTKGDTRITLPSFIPRKADFIYIDGGHSLETIMSDWMNCLQTMHEQTIVLFDDYWHGDKAAGCASLIDNLDDKYTKELLGLDVFGGISTPKRTISIAKVTLRR